MLGILTKLISRSDFYENNKKKERILESIKLILSKTLIYSKKVKKQHIQILNIQLFNK
jgi:hypothetical protein